MTEADKRLSTNTQNEIAVLAYVNDALGTRIALQEHNVRMREELALDEVTKLTYGDGIVRIELADGDAINITSADAMSLVNRLIHVMNQNLGSVLADILC